MSNDQIVDADTLEKMKNSVNDRNKLAYASVYISDALNWSETVEGHDYWAEVAQRLNNYVAVNVGTPPSNPKLITDLVGKASKNSAPLTGPIHVYHAGGSMCDTEGVHGKLPQEWPAGHSRVGIKDRQKATCSFCVIKARTHVEEETARLKK